MVINVTQDQKVDLLINQPFNRFFYFYNRIQ